MRPFVKFLPQPSLSISTYVCIRLLFLSLASPLLPTILPLLVTLRQASGVGNNHESRID